MVPVCTPMASIAKSPSPLSEVYLGGVGGGIWGGVELWNGACLRTPANSRTAGHETATTRRQEGSRRATRPLGCQTWSREETMDQQMMSLPQAVPCLVSRGGKGGQ